MRKSILAGFIALAVAAAAAQTRDFDKVQIRVTPVAGNVYMLDGTGGFAGGNIGVQVGEDGILIVDDQFAPLAPKIQAALKGVTDKPVKFILNTHFHGDHTGGNEFWGQQAPILAQENVRNRLLAAEKYNGKPGPTPKVALPVITFREGVTIHLNGDDVRAVHMPAGHTDGDTVVYFTKANVVHMGDDFFNGVYPFIDLKGGGSVRGYLENLEVIIPQLKPDTKVIPGHGPLGNVEDMKRMAEMLRGVIAIVDAGIKAGKTAEQMKQEKALAKYDKWSWDFFNSDSFLETVYNDLKGEHGKATFLRHNGSTPSGKR